MPRDVSLALLYLCPKLSQLYAARVRSPAFRQALASATTRKLPVTRIVPIRSATIESPSALEKTAEMATVSLEATGEVVVEVEVKVETLHT